MKRFDSKTKQFYILGQRVNTYKFGLGTIVGFEDLRGEIGDSRRTGKTVITEHQTENNARIVVKLDNPENWPFGTWAQPLTGRLNSSIAYMKTTQLIANQ